MRHYHDNTTYLLLYAPSLLEPWRARDGNAGNVPHFRALVISASRKPILQKPGMMHHRVVVPKLSSAHRFACLALYRALLRQCNRISSIAPKLSAAESHIRDRFRRYKNLQSPSQTANALKAGYEGLDLLYSAAQGNKKDSGFLQSILSHAKSAKECKRKVQAAIAERLPAKQPTRKQLKAQENRRLQETTARRHPDTIPILSRPRPVVSGRRHVPVLVNACGVPFLRIKKPQPLNLSRVIHRKIAHRWHLVERRDRLMHELYFAGDEDEWDSLTIGLEPETWYDAVRDSYDDTINQIRVIDDKNIARSEAMWEVVLAERELAVKEKLAAEEHGLAKKGQMSTAT
ncbi:hypothetical protein BJY00DRAFT_143386 [Aspergillus carlsbadensis]|nr:hypothetical protein BJY00DRAFT_143386 [Aspergillus carlsbadensis]